MPVNLPESLRGITLWHYTSLEALLAILQTKELHFSQLGTFRDPYEGQVPIAWEGGPFDVSELLEQTGDAGGSSEWREVRIFPQGRCNYPEDEGLRTELYVNCWHNNQAESAAMWSLYSGKAGVAIKSTSEQLAHALRACQVSVEIAGVSYMDIVPGLICGSPWTIKRPSFEHEKEVRACIRDPNCKQSALPVPVDVEALIGEVYVSCESPDWHEGVVRDVVKKYGLAKPVQRSPLLTLK